MMAWDKPLFIVCIALMLLGLVMIYSASIALSESPKYKVLKPSATYFLMRQMIFIVVGMAAAAVAFRIPLAKWQRWSPYLFIATIVLLVAVLVPGLGRGINGAKRWISLYALNLQPSEVMKLMVVLYAADYTVRKQAMIHQFRKGFLPMAAVVVLVGALLQLEPDLGAFMVIAAVAFGILFLGGVNARMFLGLSGAMGVGFVLMVMLNPWRRARFFAYLDPFDEDNAAGKAYQLTHSLIAFGRGEWFGVGLGGSVEKLHYLPEAHTDFLLAVIGEELGLVGVVIVVGLFFWLVQRSFEIGRQAIALERTYAGLVAKGVGIWIGVQAFINMGVNLGLLPTKGLTLPLMSYGGSGILVNCVAFALVLRVDYENRILMRGGRV
ncbi:MAG: putative lipid II flippase FtsW [Burkholderiaceae bacterium]